MNSMSPGVLRDVAAASFDFNKIFRDCAWAIRITTSSEHKVDALFDHFDSNGDGRMCQAEGEPLLLDGTISSEIGDSWEAVCKKLEISPLLGLTKEDLQRLYDGLGRRCLDWDHGYF